MNVALASTYLSGGAGGAARRLHDGFVAAGVRSTLITRDPAGAPGIVHAQAKPGSPHEKARWALDRIPKLAYRHRDGMRMFHPEWVPDLLWRQIRRAEPDVVNLHWICNSFLGVGSLERFRKPVVWSVHDMWPFTGGCFYSEDCDRYSSSCGRCPVLGSSHERDLSRWTWMRKSRSWRRVDLTIVAPSTWLADCARESGLFRGRRVERIPYGLDLTRFSPRDRREARAAFGLPQDKKIVLVGAWGDPVRKGLDLLQAALPRLAKVPDEAPDLVVFGTAGEVVAPGFRSHHLGRVVGEDAMARLYSAADVTVVPSKWEALGFVALESIACGTPVIAYDAPTGLRDVVDHRVNGYLARAFDPDDLAHGIAWVIGDPDRHAALSRMARAKAERDYSIDGQVRRYLDLFADLIAADSRSASGTERI